MPIYEYENKKTGEILEVLRSIKDRDKPYTLDDGTICERIISKSNGWKGNKEVFEADPDYVKKCRPKYVKFHDGHREKYDPTKHN